MSKIGEWFRVLGVDSIDLPTTGAETVIGLAAKRCYMSFEVGHNPNITKVRKNWHEYFENILKSGHGSVLEHACYTYAVEGCSRVFTAEMNRHRAGVAISEGSLRYIRFDDIPWWMPLSLRPCDNDSPELAFKKGQTAALFVKAFQNAESTYKELVQLWDLDNEKNFDVKKKITSCLRRIIPMGVATGGVWTMNIRALRHIIALRTSEHAEEEIAYIMGMIAKDICEREPSLFCDFEQLSGVWIPRYQKV